MRPIHTLLISSLLLVVASCGGSTPAELVDAGADNLTKDPKASLAAYEEALAAIDATHPRFLEATLGKYKAQSYFDPAAAKSGFLAFAEKQKLQASDYRLQVDELYTAAVRQASSGDEEDMEGGRKTIELAIAVLAAGGKAFPEDPKLWETITKKVGDKAKTLGADEGAMKLLEGLGYIGG